MIHAGNRRSGDRNELFVQAGSEVGQRIKPIADTLNLNVCIEPHPEPAPCQVVHGAGLFGNGGDAALL